MIYNTLFNPRYGRGMLVKALNTLRQYDRPELALGGMRSTASCTRNMPLSTC